MHITFLLLLLFTIPLFSQHWHQGSGPNGNYRIKGNAATAWSVSLNKGIQWKIPLPETGQSTPIVIDNKVFLTCFKPVQQDQKMASDLVAHCFDANNGKRLWSRDLPGSFDSRMSGCFGDNSGPAAISDGKTVVFFNASGTITKFDFSGNLIWSQQIMNSARSDPFLWQGKILFCGSSNDLTKIAGRHLKCLDYKTGQLLWKSSSHSWDGLTPFPYRRPNGQWVALTARGGGHVHDPYEDGLSLLDLDNGKELWSYTHKGLMSTQNFQLYDDKAYVFIPNGLHLVLDLHDGRAIATQDLLSHSPADQYSEGAYQTNIISQVDMRKRSIIQMSNLLFDQYHFFRTYNDNYLGRLDVKTGKTQFIQLPTQIQRDQNGTLSCWNASQILDEYPLKKKQKTHLSNTWLIQRNQMENHQGFKVFGDDRSQFSGWGHHSSALPIVAGDYLYVPTMSGLVYILKWNNEDFDHSSLISISDLGPLGDSWTRSSLAIVDGKIYARTIKELICIDGVSPQEIFPNY